MPIGPDVLIHGVPPMVTPYFWVTIWFHGVQKKQPTVARSSCESEYRAMANTASEIIWLTNLLKELHVVLSRSATCVTLR